VAHKLMDTFRECFKEGLKAGIRGRIYDTPVFDGKIDSGDIPYGIGRVTRTFNGICSEAGLQCTISGHPDPVTNNHLYFFKNLGDRLVQISYDNETRLLEPGEEVVLSIPAWTKPEIRNINYGNQDAD
jgi:hypothetical protein